MDQQGYPQQQQPLGGAYPQLHGAGGQQAGLGQMPQAYAFNGFPPGAYPQQQHYLPDKPMPGIPQPAAGMGQYAGMYQHQQMPGGPAPGGMPGLSMPFITLPGGTMIRPQLAGAGGGYPQLIGLGGGPGASNGMTFLGGPPGIPTIMSQPAGVPQHIASLPPLGGAPRAVAIKSEPEDRPSSSHSANTSAGGLGSDGSPQVGSGGTPGSSGGNKSRYRGVSYDRKKAKWRVQIKVAALGKSGVSVGYFDTEEAAARAYDRAAIGLLGRDNPNLQTNFELTDYAEEPIPRLTGKTREEVKTTLKSERIKVRDVHE